MRDESETGNGPRRQSSWMEIALDEKAMGEKVIDFNAWRRQRPMPAAIAPGQKDHIRSAEIVSLFSRQAPIPAAAATMAPMAMTTAAMAPAAMTPAAMASAMTVTATATAKTASAAPDRAGGGRNEAPPIGKWHRGLAWFVAAMADGTTDMNNLQTILSDMQDELDALETSMERLRADEPELVSSSPGIARTARRACDITGQAVANHAPDMSNAAE